jgi:hypothetical protein
MHIRMADSVEDRDFSGDINLGMNLDTGLGTSKLRPSKDRHAQVDGSGINGIEPPMEFKLFGDASGLCHVHDVKGKLLEDSGISEVVDLGKDAPVNGDTTESQMKRSFCMSDSNVSKFSKAMTAYELTIHDDQHVTPVGWSHSGCPVIVFGYQPLEVAFGEKLHNLSEYVFANVHTFFFLFLSAKEQNSKGRQGFYRLSY